MAVVIVITQQGLLACKSLPESGNQHVTAGPRAAPQYGGKADPSTASSSALRSKIIELGWASVPGEWVHSGAGASNFLTGWCRIRNDKGEVCCDMRFRGRDGRSHAFHEDLRACGVRRNFPTLTSTITEVGWMPRGRGRPVGALVEVGR